MIFKKVDFSIQGGLDFQLPKMLHIRQEFNCDRIFDPTAATMAALDKIQMPPLQGKRVGITAGSRHLDNLPEILRATARFLRRYGAIPFVIPAMGSHGGATADGQKLLLQNLGITEETVDMPIISSMETKAIGTYPDGSPVVCSQTALEADYIIICARIKMHTSIRGPVESGLCKMMVVGLGKHLGAATFHRHGYDKLAEFLPRAGKTFLKTLPLLCGLALVENAYDQTATIEAIPPQRLITREQELLMRAKSLMPRFLLDEIDVLIVEKFGKDISGAGMDPNITGRAITPLPMSTPVPIKSIVALDLTGASYGNAIGIGGADLTTRRVIQKIDFTPSYTNAFTSGAFCAMKLPIILNDDEQAIRVAIRCAPRSDLASVKVVRISDTLHLGEIDVSENYLPLLERHKNITILGVSSLRFTREGRLISLLETAKAHK
ncbi:hypothetical protein CE91St46_15180 [Eubacteriales bacterium]|nr:DUF362 domain-containing protein [Faecalicatena sp. BF-R-105]GKH50407.1 hypothetical protein CE91St46_15180 [Eubacteriales bacterium]GKH63130.1 hypothetical protein CE91St47_15990 [Eubacteriales bacterium]